MNWVLLKNSLLVGGVSVGLSVAFGLMAALWVAGLERAARNAVFLLAAVALALPPFLATNCWLHFLGASGVWRGWLPLNIFSLGGAIWILSLLTWPVTFFLVSGARRRLEPAQLESDPALTGWWLIRGLLAPLARTALAQAAAVTLVLALNNFAVPTILQVKVFTEEIWVRFNTAFDTRGALMLSWPLLLAPMLVLALLARREIPWPRRETTVSPKLFRRQLGRGWFSCCGLGTILLCVLSVGLPLVQLLGTRRTWVELPGALAAGKWAIWYSLLFAGAAATLIAAFALAAGDTRTQVRFEKSSRNAVNWYKAFNLIIWLPFLLPGVLLGIALIKVFNHPWSSRFYTGAGIVILAFGIRYFGLGWNAVVHSMGSADRDLLDVARLNGATRWQTLRYVLWPQIGPLVLAAWYVVFLLCLWDVESMILVTPPGGETLALRIFNLLHYGHNGQVNALCLALLALALAPLAAWCVVRGVWSASTLRVPRSTLLLLGTASLLTGCSPQSPANEAALNSSLFSRVQIIGTRGVGVGELNKPRSVAVDRQDNMYVVDMTGRVQKFSPSGALLLAWQLPQTDKGKPKGMCRDHLGNIVVVEPHYQRVNHFSTNGDLLAQWGQYGTNAGQFSLPRGIAVSSHGDAYVSEYGLVERVQRFELGEGRRVGAGQAKGERSEADDRQQDLPKQKAESGNKSPAEKPVLEPRFLASFGRMGSGPGEFNRPEGLCVDSQDRLYVADSCNHRIQIFSSDGKFIRAYGKAGTGKGDLSYPYDICVDSSGLQYVCEFGNSRIQVFDAQDQPLEIIGGPGADPGKFSNPWGVALDSVGDLYVADSLNHRVQKLIRKKSVARGEYSVSSVQYSELNTEHRLLNIDY